MKKINLYIAAIIAFSFLFFNCEKDIINTNNNSKSLKNEIEFKDYKLSELKEEPILKKAFLKLKNKTLKNGKTLKQKNLNFSLDTLNIRKIKYTNVTSYTIPIKRPRKTPNYFENLVIQKTGTGKIKTFIIKYIPNERIKKDSEHHSFFFDGRRYIKEINFDVSNLNLKAYRTYYYRVTEFWCSYGYHHVAGPSCFEATDGRVYKKTYTKRVVIDDGNDSEITQGGGLGNDPEGENNYGGGNTNNNEEIITTPIKDDCPGKDVNGVCVEDDKIDPCKKLKDQLDPKKANIKPELNSLKAKVGNHREYGYAFIKKSDGTLLNREVQVSALDYEQVNIPPGNGVYAGAHSHTDELMPMFSWSDVHTLYSLYNKAETSMKSSVVLYLVSRDTKTSPANVYGIVVEDFTKLEEQLNKDITNIVKNSKKLNGSSSLKKVIKALNENLGDEYKRAGNNEKTFLDEFKKHGMKLYKANSSLTNFSELSLNTSNNVISTPCK